MSNVKTVLGYVLGGFALAAVGVVALYQDKPARRPDAPAATAAAEPAPLVPRSEEDEMRDGWLEQHDGLTLLVAPHGGNWKYHPQVDVRLVAPSYALALDLEAACRRRSSVRVWGRYVKDRLTGEQLLVVRRFEG